MQIEIPDPLFKRLQKYAEPIVDDAVSVIGRWGDFYEQHHPAAVPHRKTQTAVDSPRSENLRELDSIHPPSLLHTIVRGEFGTNHFSNWNDLLRIAHLEAFKKAKSFEELRRITQAQISNGSRADRGFHFLNEIGISLQGVDANRGWQYALRLAKYLAVPLKAVVEWRHNDKAVHPGERALLSWAP